LKKASLLAFVSLILTLAAVGPLRSEEPTLKPRRTADFRAEIGVDSLERRYYRPTFRFSFPLPGAQRWRWNAGLM
jgi:hypothetical protein